MLSKELILELQTIIEEDYGPKLPEEWVERVGLALCDMTEIYAEMDQLPEQSEEHYNDKQTTNSN